MMIGNENKQSRKPRLMIVLKKIRKKLASTRGVGVKVESKKNEIGVANENE